MVGPKGSEGAASPEEADMGGLKESEGAASQDEADMVGLKGSEGAASQDEADMGGPKGRITIKFQDWFGSCLSITFASLSCLQKAMIASWVILECPS